MFEYTNGVVESRKSKTGRKYNGQEKDRQYNGQEKDRQCNGQEKDRQYNGHCFDILSSSDC